MSVAKYTIVNPNDPHPFLESHKITVRITSHSLRSPLISIGRLVWLLRIGPTLLRKAQSMILMCYCFLGHFHPIFFDVLIQSYSLLLFICLGSVMRRYSPPYYSPPRRGYGGRTRSTPRRGPGNGYGRRKEQNHGSLLVRNIPLNCR
ncbi:hypothetical protein ACSBR2_005530 [Camellia fascicularis]